MKLSTWRPTIKPYFDNLLNPDGWYVDTPPDEVLHFATLPPITTASFELSPPFKVTAHLTQELYYMERVSADRWHSLPVEYYEGVYGQLVYSILTDSKHLHPDIISIDVGHANLGGHAKELPIVTEQLADSWLVQLKWAFQAKVLLTPESSDPVIPITTVLAELWTNELADSTFTVEHRSLDVELTTDND